MPTEEVGDDPIIEEIKNIVADKRVRLPKNGCILVPREHLERPDPLIEHIKAGDKRTIDSLPENCESGLRYDIKLGKNKRRFMGVVKMGKRNAKSKTMTVYSYESRFPLTDAEGLPLDSETPYIDNYGQVWFWEPLEINNINGDIDKLQEAMGIGGK